ncbi:MAG: hypothetical protein RL447_1217, partial [Bacteroidota bacterium]
MVDTFNEKSDKYGFVEKVETRK